MEFVIVITCYIFRTIVRMMLLSENIRTFEFRNPCERKRINKMEFVIFIVFFSGQLTSLYCCQNYTDF